MSDNYISCKEENGSINISEDVISTMVQTAITEIDGVAAISNTAGGELAELIGLKTISKGIKVQIVDDTIKVDAIILVRYGCNIVNVAREVQNSVTEVVQAITGIDKAEVNVHVSGVAFENKLRGIEDEENHCERNSGTARLLCIGK